jgi:hypothetical protein
LSSRLPPYRPSSAYTPFLRRFTDERAHDLAETVKLYNRVADAHRGTIWAEDDVIERVSNLAAEQVTNIVEVPNYIPLCKALDTCQLELLALETTIFSQRTVDFSKPLSLKDQVDLNRHLRAQEYFLEHQDRISEQLLTALVNVSGGLLQSLPPLADSTFTVPFISLLPDPSDVVDRIIGTVCDPALADAGLFTAVQDQIYVNMCRFANVPLDGSSKKPLITAADADLAPEELVDTYLAATPFHSLFFTHVPFALPEEQRFSGHWIIAPPGRGKTTLLHSMFLDDVSRDASIIVMDSKGDLINPIRSLKDIADRLLIIDPDEDFPLALNPLDIPKTSVTHAVSLLEYVFSSLLEAKMTSLQMTLFRSVLPALVIGVPNPTLETFRDIIENGYKPYKEHIDKLTPDIRNFFYKQFDTKTYTDTRNQLVWRLQFLMTNPVIRTMFSSIKTKLDIGKEMDAGKIILINNSKAILGDEGSEFFGRFFIALILAAAQQRSNRKERDKLPCFVYIDECHNVIKRDEKIPTILDECRSQKIALILAHQRTEQITSANVLSALSNCAIRFANSDNEAKYLADKLRTTPEFLRSLRRGTFAAFVRDVTPQALALKIPYYNLSKLPQMTSNKQASLRERMRAEYSYIPSPPLSAHPTQPSASIPQPSAPYSPSATVLEQPKKPQSASDTPEVGSTW